MLAKRENCFFTFLYICLVIRLGFFLIVPFQNVEPTEVVHTETKVALTKPRVPPTYYKVLPTKYNK